MKKQIARIFAVVLAVLMLSTCMVGCQSSDGPGAGDGEKVVLKIAFVKAGFGEEWLKAICAAYTAEHPNVTFDLEGDPDMTVKIGTRLESGANLPDIAMVLGSNWQQYAARGYLADLSDVYSSEMENGVTFHDKIIDSNQEVGRFAGKYYMIPWADGCNGFVYNKKLFQRYKTLRQV